jgi:hypothetical protein
MSWENMGLSKNVGGLGYRDLKSFNDFIGQTRVAFNSKSGFSSGKIF